MQLHPDDIEIFAGGFVALMRERGKEVIYVTVTDGGMGTFDPELSPGELVVIRRREAQEAASVLGADKHIFLGYPDTDVLSHRELREKFIKLLREEKPDGILLPDPWLPYEAHLGHVIVGLAGAEAVLFSPMPLFEPKGVPRRVSFVAFYATHRPNIFIDITSKWEKKLEAIKRHKSQFPPEVFSPFFRYLEMKAKEWGEGKGFEKAEAFKVLTPYHLHGNVDTLEC
ncbi:PIG-L deacetylase family protein [Candidatus Hakubella thermalkaliphila]|uniref:PIG-L deacetylase family protein n=1 Tax=Candidatus Hakubella thermalkaliphila TaxID=2754717 RepID=UPI002158B88A|nr:PIG-L deacetylase family protein [Candidatus Hakubella thermalkaliphila]